MAVKRRRRRYECFACGKLFNGPQALFGHRRHCPRLKRQAEVQPTSQPQLTIRAGKRPGPLSQEAKLVSLDALEGLEQLVEVAKHFATVSNMLVRMNANEDDERAKTWTEIYQVLNNCHRDLESMLPAFHLDRGVLFGIYQALRRLKECWIKQRVCGADDPTLEPDGLSEEMRTALREEQAQFTRLIDQFKRLVAAAP